MKKGISILLIIAVLSTFLCLQVTAADAKENEWIVTTTFTHFNKEKSCTSFVHYDQNTDTYTITMQMKDINKIEMVFYLKDGSFSFDNMNNPTSIILLNDLWDAMAENIYKVYETVYGESMQGRTAQGLSRELRLHEWMLRNSIVINTFFFDMQGILNRSQVTDCGVITDEDDGDRNAYIFEQAQTDAEVILMYAADIMESGVANVILRWIYPVLGDSFWKLVDRVMSMI